MHGLKPVPFELVGDLDTNSQYTVHGRRIARAGSALREGRPMPAEPDDADELVEAYDQVILELEGGGSTCPKCGGALGATTTMNTAGCSYHPECVRGW
jgi:hypothetical protein